MMRGPEQLQSIPKSGVWSEQPLRDICYYEYNLEEGAEYLGNDSLGRAWYEANKTQDSFYFTPTGQIYFEKVSNRILFKICSKQPLRDTKAGDYDWPNSCKFLHLDDYGRAWYRAPDHQHCFYYDYLGNKCVSLLPQIIKKKMLIEPRKLPTTVKYARSAKRYKFDPKGKCWIYLEDVTGFTFRLIKNSREYLKI